MKLVLLVLLGVAVGTGAVQATTVLLDDTFTEASRTGTPNAPTSVPWYNGSATAGNLTLSGTPQTLNYVPDSTPVFGTIPTQILGVGDSLTLAVTFTLTGNVNSASGFRLGLFNSGGNPVTADGTTATNALYATYAGYAAFVDLGPTSTTSTALEKRISGTNQNLLTSGAPVPLGTTTGGAPDLSAGTSYTMTLQVTRTTSTSNTVGFSLNGVTFSDVDTSLPPTSFDSIVLFDATSQATKIAFSEIKVSYAAAPEPPAAALLGGAGFLALLALARARTRHSRTA